MMFKFGDKVKTKFRLIRKKSIIYNKEWRKWEAFKRFNPDEECIFLGYRTLKNGIIYYEPDVGMLLDVREYVKAALIAPNGRQNPFYTLINFLEKIKNG